MSEVWMNRYSSSSGSGGSAFEDLRRHAREREAVGVAAVDDELHALPGILFQDPHRAAGCRRPGEEPVEQPAQDRACVAREEVAQLRSSGLPESVGQAPVVVEDGRGRCVLGQRRQRGLRACGASRGSQPTSCWNSAMAFASGLVRGAASALRPPGLRMAAPGALCRQHQCRQHAHGPKAAGALQSRHGSPRRTRREMMHRLLSAGSAAVVAELQRAAEVVLAQLTRIASCSSSFDGEVTRTWSA